MRSETRLAADHPLEDRHLAQIARYLDEGGNLLWLTEPDAPAGLGVAGLLTSDSFALPRVLDSHTHGKHAL